MTMLDKAKIDPAFTDTRLAAVERRLAEIAESGETQFCEMPRLRSQ